MESASARRVTGTVCHVGFYGLTPNGTALFQCLFAQISRCEPFLCTLHSYVARGPRLTQEAPLRVLRRTYLSVARANDETRNAFVAERSRLLAYLLLDSTPQLARLSRVFTPVALTVSETDVEILDVELLDELPGFPEALQAYGVARLTAIGSYHEPPSESPRHGRPRRLTLEAGEPLPPPPPPPPETPTGEKSLVATLAAVAVTAGATVSSRRLRPTTTAAPAGAAAPPPAAPPLAGREEKADEKTARTVLEKYGTHANYKLQSGYGVRDVTFSVRLHRDRYLFDGSETRSWPLRRLFASRDVVLRDHTRVRLVAPQGFLGIVFAEDQCVLLLRTALDRLQRALYSDFDGLRPSFDYLGPDLLPPGPHRSVFCPAFPYVSLYAAPARPPTESESVDDLIGEVRSQCGLPDVVGACGKLEVPIRSDWSCALDPAELRVFAVTLNEYRLNGARFAEYEDERDGQDTLKVYIGPEPLYRVRLADLRAILLRDCLPPRDADFLLRGRGGRRRDLWTLCTRYLARLQWRSPHTYETVRGLEGYLSQHLTSAYTAAGYSWVAVRQDREFYVNGLRERHVSLEVCTRTVFGCYWRKLFRDRLPEPTAFVVEQVSGALVWHADRLLGGACLQRTEESRHWWEATGDTLAEVVRCLYENAEWFGFETFKEQLRRLVFRFISRRYAVDFWVDRFAAGAHPVAAHAGLLDCAPFDGVWVRGELVHPQSRDAALHDAIDYGAYIDRACGYLLVAVCHVMLAARGAGGGEAAAEEEKDYRRAIRDLIGSVKTQIMTEYLDLFDIN
ncbi:T102 [Tupaiid betaherpesvirus 1]|uniref:T102 n=1 Tax=Tupaiid herpesvirus 1 (strain 1) TaxID=10397 RepID=Q91TK1_TUHV1|nr:T102 [Tupaiid betaherpesvirus 1]AAK57146.1 T102 [Tupaiid betaherpesvirus 1]